MSAIRKILLASVAMTMSTAAFAQDVTVLRIGLDGGENESDQLRRSECVVDSLKAATGVSEVQFFPSPDYNGVIQGLLGGTIDIAIMGASSYASIYLQDPEAVEPVLTTQQEDGSTGYHTRSWSHALTSGITDAGLDSRARSSALPIRTPPRATSFPNVCAADRSRRADR
jgi:phosphonate transport system substrate-binding protein